MATDTSKGIITVFDEFNIDHIGTSGGDGIQWLVTLDNSGTLAPVASAELQAASVTGTANNNLNDFYYRDLSFRAQDGFMSWEMRLDLAGITNVAINVGFNDDVNDASDSLPVELSGTTFTSNAGTFVGFVFDTDATNDNWHVFMVDDNNDTSVPIACLNTGIAPVANIPQTFKIVVEDNGACNQTRTSFYIDGLEVYTMVSSIDRDILMSPGFGHENRACGATTVNLHYVEAKKSRP